MGATAQMVTGRSRCQRMDLGGQQELVVGPLEFLMGSGAAHGTSYV